MLLELDELEQDEELHELEQEVLHELEQEELHELELQELELDDDEELDEQLETVPLKVTCDAVSSARQKG